MWVLCGFYLRAAVGTDVKRFSLPSTLTQTCLSVPQFGSCSSFGTFRPAFSHSGTIIRPLSVILPASPTFNHSPGSNTPSPTSKVPSWKVCFHLQFFAFGFHSLLKLFFFLNRFLLLLVFNCLHLHRRSTKETSLSLWFFPPAVPHHQDTLPFFSHKVPKN